MAEYTFTKLTTLKKHWLSVAFLLGFITDLVLLNRVDDLVDNLILLGYVLLSTLGIVLFYSGIAEKLGERGSAFMVRFMPYIMQYAFGGLLSGMLIFYGRSGDFMASAPYFLLLLVAIICNEVLQKRSSRLLYTLALYFVGLFSYCVLIVPVWLGQINDFVFVGSGLLALVLTLGLVKFLKRLIPQFIALQKRLLIFTIGTIFVTLNGLYFYNLIPPIPLSLTELSILHGVERNQSTGSYRLLVEEKPWYQAWLPITQKFTPLPGDGAYCYARVFAPTSISATIVHRWSLKDSNGVWQEQFAVDYRIVSGNDNGYRGYTVATKLRTGEWRCTVQNQRGQVLGHRTFTVNMSGVVPPLVTVLE